MQTHSTSRTVHPNILPALRLLTEFLHALLTGDGLARALADAGVGPGALAADGERAAMTVAAVAADFTQPADVLLDLTTKSAFDQDRAVDDPDDLGQLVLVQFLRPALRV